MNVPLFVGTVVKAIVGTMLLCLEVALMCYMPVLLVLERLQGLEPSFIRDGHRIRLRAVRVLCAVLGSPLWVPMFFGLFLENIEDWAERVALLGSFYHTCTRDGKETRELMKPW